MTTTMNIADAKAKLSELVARAEAGEDVVIARHGKPAARLVAARPQPKAPRKLGQWDHLNLNIPDSLFFDPDPDLEKAAHEGPVFPRDE